MEDSLSKPVLKHVIDITLKPRIQDMRATKWANTLFLYKDASFSVLLDPGENCETKGNLQIYFNM